MSDPVNFTPPWRSASETGNQSDVVKSTEVAAAIGKKIDAINGQGRGVSLDATSSVGGVTGSQLAAQVATPVASVFDFIALKTTPMLVYLQSWDGTDATVEACGLFRLASKTNPNGVKTDGGVDFITASGAYYTRTGVVNGADPAWYGAIGDGTSHPASQTFQSLAALQVFFPSAYSLNQERDWLAVNACTSNPRGVNSPKRHYILANAAVAQDDYPLIWISGIVKGSFGDSTLDFTALQPVTTVIEHMPDSDFTATDNIPWQNAWVYPPTELTNTVFSGNAGGGAVYTDPASMAKWTGTVANGTMTVTNFKGAPPLAVGDTVYDSLSLLKGVTITAYGTGTGGNGTYTISDSTTTITAGQNANFANATGGFTQFGQKVTLDPGFYTIALDYEITLGASIKNGNVQPVNLGIYFGKTGPFDPGGSDFGDGSVGLSNPTLDETVPVKGTLTFDFSVVGKPGTAFPSCSMSGYGNLRVTRFSITTLHKNTAIYATRDGALEHYPNPLPVESVRIYGPGSSSGVRGIWYNSFQNTDGTIMNMRLANVQGFQNGMLFQNGAYLSEYWDCSVSGCSICLNFPPGSINAGENFRWYGGGLANAEGAMVSNPGNGEFTFFGTTLDYSNQCIANNAGRVDIIGCHMEMNGPGVANRPLFHCIGSGTINVKGGMFLGAGNADTYQWPPVQLDTNMAAMTFDGTQVYNLTCQDGRALSGPGTLKLKNVINTGNANIGTFANASSDRLGLAGQFFTQKKSLLCSDGIGLIGGLYSDVVAPVDRWTSETASVTPSTDFVFGKGDFSLKCVTQGQSRNDRVVLCVPLSLYETGNYTIQVLFPNDMSSSSDPTQQIRSTTRGGTGNVATTYDGYSPTDTGKDGKPNAVVYARAILTSIVGYDAFGRPIFGGTDRFAGETDLRLTQAGNTDWMLAGFACAYLGLPGKTDPDDINNYAAGAPAFATHVAIVLDTESLPATTYYIGAFMGNPF